MRCLVLCLVFFCVAAISEDAPTRERELHFVSGADHACSRNCLHVSVNGGPYRPIGCNKVALGDCRSPGGLRGRIKFAAYEDRCNSIRLKVFSQGKDNGVVHESLLSTHPGLLRGRHYKINRRTSSLVDLWLNDNSDNDPYDFRAILFTDADTSFGIDRFDGAGCRPL